MYFYVITLVCIDIDDCQSSPCQNDGVCVDGVNSFTCNCAHGFIGDDCSISKIKFNYKIIALNT